MGMFHILISDDPPHPKIQALSEQLEKKLKVQTILLYKNELNGLETFHQSDLVIILASGRMTKDFDFIKSMKLSDEYDMIPILILNPKGKSPDKVKGIRVEPDGYAKWSANLPDIVERVKEFLDQYNRAISEKKLRKQIVFQIQNELRYLFKVNNLISNQFIQVGVIEDETVNLRLTLDELGTNAIRHGNKNDPDKKLIIHCSIYEEHLSIVIEDQGPGFKATDIPDPTTTERILLPSGRGIFIARQLMDKVHFHEPGNRVEFVKKLSLKPEKSSSSL